MTQSITWHSLSNPIKTLLSLILVQNSVICFSMLHASSKLDESDGIIFVGDHANDQALNPSPTVEIQSTEGVDLNCFPRNTVWSKDRWKGPKQFDCGSNQFEITSFDSENAEDFLGGLFVESKTLKELGCKNDNDRIVCYEEVTVTQGRAAGIKAHRSFSATFSKKESE
jgi:hypothetical protein